MWMGSDLSTADEWLELTYVPIGSGASNLQVVDGWYLTVLNSKKEEKTIFTFPFGTSVGSGQFVVVSNYAAEKSRLLSEPDFVTTAITLPNTKLLLRLYDASGALIDLVDDGVGAPFAGEKASGTGARRSMERLVLTRPGSDKENWASASTYLGFDDGTNLFGTPGFPNGTGQTEEFPNPEPEEGSGTFVHPQVYITEVLSNPKGKDDYEWIELGNLGTGSVSISGWILDEGNSPGVFVIPTNFLQPGEHISFRKSVCGLSIGNKGEQLYLMSGSHLIDSWAYPETAEEVSYGRSTSGSGAFRSFCMPTEGAPNTAELLDPSIIIQSGKTSGVGKVSLNLIAEVSTGSLASASCSWVYSDGFTSQSCNPPSHSFKESGTHTVQLSVETYCGNVVERELAAEVLAVVSKARKKKKKPGTGITLRHFDPAQYKQAQGDICTAQYSSDVIISEFLPNPYGSDTEGEWVELWNIGNETVSLCGWLLDDEEGGSKPYYLEEEIIAPQEYLLLQRNQTKIALNNDADTVRLFAGSGNLVSEATYVKGIEGESMGLQEDGLFVWTPYLTPNEANSFRVVEKIIQEGAVIVSAALPNPIKEDSKGDWIELSNVSEEELLLTGWFLDNKEGGSAPFLLSGVTLASSEIRRFYIQETSIDLTNTTDVARLLDPNGYATSILGWTDATEGIIYRPPVFRERVAAHVVHVVDGDTIDIVLTDIDHLDRVPSALKRKWLGIQYQDEPSIRVRLLGIDAPETLHPSEPVEELGVQASEFTRALLEGQNIELEFDAELFDKYERLLAYVFTESGAMVQSELLRQGLAQAYLHFPFARAEEFVAYEKEARYAERGLWVHKVIPSEDTSQVAYKQEVFISEVYSSPLSTGSMLEAEEWIEISNLTDNEVSLDGWILDDVRDGGSKPHVLSADAVVPPLGSIILLHDQIKVSLNNDGDDLWLLSPDGSVEIGLSYPKIKKGKAYALVRSSWCITGSSTPLEQNICTTIAPIKRASRKTAFKRARPRSRFLWERYRNVVASGTGEAITFPSVWQSLKHLENTSEPQKKTSGETEALVITLMFLPALRFLTL